MKKKCNLNVFFKEFKVEIKRKVYGVKSFNGYYDANNYKSHLKDVLENFKYDMFYALPFEESADKKVFLLNIFTELTKKQVGLEYTFQKIIQNSTKKECNHYHSFKGLKHIILMCKNASCRRITCMFHLQKKQFKYCIRNNKAICY